tara:strand:+ start:8650 stop:10485 length:1836 start_codon:yes stop_codon:yes gene_type:complete
MAVIGISCFFHDSAAALLGDNGEILAAVQEERFSRKKHDSRFPICSIDYCLKRSTELGLEIEAYIYYEKPIRIFMRLLETYFNTAPRGFSSFLPAMQSWIKEKLFIKDNIAAELKHLDINFSEEKLFFSEHHLSHAGSAYYPSPFNKSAILCMDAVGEWATSSAWIGDEEKISPVWEINFPDSLGMLYSAFTYYCGFKVNSGEYKLMGLAPYGKPIYKDLILNNLINVKEDGSFKLDMSYFKYHRGLRMISRKFINLFGHIERKPEEKLTQFYMDVAASIQEVTEYIVLKIAKNLHKKTGEKNLCLSGGVALNCVANGKLLDDSGFENIWIQPASGDAGSAVGCGLNYLYEKKKIKRNILSSDSMKSAYLGPKFNTEQIENYLNKIDINYEKLNKDQLCVEVANELAKGNVVGWFQGRMEYGPRALGNRSILGDPRLKKMQKTMNLKIKFRESFRPFAPVILEGFQNQYFGIKNESPYMLITRKLRNEFLKNQENQNQEKVGIERLDIERSTLPAITHVDNSCRVQTVSKERNPDFHKLLEEFYKLTNCPILINTSFNVRGEPIVCTPEDALRCFANTNIDIVVIENFIIKKDQCNNLLKEKFLKTILIND